jgi:alpha-ribazole phosphatase
MEVYLIRHTAPAVDKGICYGASDVPLAASFDDEYLRLKKHLPEKTDAVYSSPLTRCQQLASRLVSAQEIIRDERLQELHFGNWEMKRWEEIPAAELEPWMQDFVHVQVPGGENFQKLYERTGLFFEELIKSGHKDSIVVSHAGAIRAIIARVLEIPLRNAFKVPVPYGSVTKLNLQPDTCYCNIEYLGKE